MKKMLRLFLIATLFFTFSLTAGSSVFAALDVNVMPSGTDSQANKWDSKGPYTWPGNNIELWGNVSYDGSGMLTYTWIFGAGEGSVGGTVSNRDNIAVTHTYPATGSFVATLTVTDGTETDTDTVFIDVVPQTIGVEKNLAIQKGLKFLYLNRYNLTVNSQPAYHWNNSGTAGSGLALMSFMNHGHLESNDNTGDIYAETVGKGLNYIFAYMYSQGASMDNTTYTDSDINGNDRKTYGSSGNMYYVGITAMTIAATSTPDAIVRDSAYSTIRGETYKTVLEDLVDYIAFAQQEGTSGYAGGWRYSANYGSSDGSVTQWPALGLGEAQIPPWNINAPLWVKTRMGYWNNYIQYSDGGFGYTAPSSWRNIAKTGAGIAGIAYAGVGGNLTNAVNYINTHWNTTAYDYGNKGDHYAMYAVKKGMEYAGLSTVGIHDWQEEYDRWLIDHQYAAGNWPASVRINHANITTAFGLLVLAPLEVCKPLADAGGDQEVGENLAVNFDGSGSTYTCPDSGSIVLYEWDFDYDGINFDVDASGPMATNLVGYDLPDSIDTENHTVALRVTDNDGKQDTDTLIVTVINGNVAPVADPGGPYLGGVGAGILLDASGSYDENEIDGSNPIANSATGSGFDEIVSYQWDIDGDGLYGSEDSPADPEGVTTTVSWPGFIGTKTIGLKVTDSFGKSAAQSAVVTTVAFTDLFPVSYELISNRYNRRTRQWTVTWKMNIMNAGNADATAVTAVLTPDSIPAGVTVNDDSLAWTNPDNIIAAGETQLSDDDFQYTYPRGSAGPDLTVATWDIQYTDDGGTQHIVRSIPQ